MFFFIYLKGRDRHSQLTLQIPVTARAVLGSGMLQPSAEDSIQLSHVVDRECKHLNYHLLRLKECIHMKHESEAEPEWVFQLVCDPLHSMPTLTVKQNKTKTLIQPNPTLTKKGKYNSCQNILYSYHDQLYHSFKIIFSFSCLNPFAVVSVELKIVPFKVKLFWSFQ